MSNFTKKFLQLTGITLGILLLICLIPDGGVIGAGILLMVICAVYFIGGLIAVMVNDKNEWGKVMLLSSLVIAVVGFSTCGLILSNLKLGHM
ncbi:hypothetical protein [Chitinophaga sp. Cy-1792]|uniref:hypothetical protein n=1 Tax=Chitinophaga sp. Cy-1792 TaxID=2608339 RepID=UPI00141E6E2E|nr:hypothetical protein [Chitinophaga sp. Cy-1792]NIG53961.1 hypothetical protein [Chitinophaga sp. Cy-1792]